MLSADYKWVSPKRKSKDDLQQNRKYIFPSFVSEFETPSCGGDHSLNSSIAGNPQYL